jgi:hypothetical protein
MIDRNFRVGDLISAPMFIGTASAFMFSMKSDIRALGLKIGFLNDKTDAQSAEIAKFAELLTLMGRYEERFLHVQNDIDDLKHGRGFINDPPRRER